MRTLQRMGDGGGARGSDEADSVACVDGLARHTLQERRGMRVADGALRRRMGKGVPGGGRDGDTLVSRSGVPPRG